MPINKLTKKLELGKKINSLISSFNKTNLDIESPEPTGGPINDKPSNYKHKYTGKPGEKYLDHFQPSASPNSGFGIKGKNINPRKNIFKKTNLDLENPLELGGPNRTNSYNIPTGQYLNKTTHNITDENGEVTLKEKDGKEVITQLNRWTPNNKYEDSKDWENKYPNLQSDNPPQIDLLKPLKNLFNSDGKTQH